MVVSSFYAFDFLIVKCQTFTFTIYYPNNNNDDDEEKKIYISGVQNYLVVQHSHVMSFCKRLEYICIAYLKF